MTDGPVEMYLLPAHSPACIVCEPSAERLVDSLRASAFVLCPQHLLRAHAYGNEQDGRPSLNALPGEGSGR